jgi:thiol-disulfide isomerase/thioredoxin
LSTNWRPSKWLGVRGGATFQQARYDEPETTFGSLRYFRTPNRYGYAGIDADVATLPDVPVSSQSGDRLNLRGWRGRIAIVNFWATWCHVFREELG